MSDQTELRVVQLRESVEADNASYEYAIQYRNETTHGLWRTLPVINIHNDREKYERMKDGAND